jgi:hypothetical protein
MDRRLALAVFVALGIGTLFGVHGTGAVTGVASADPLAPSYVATGDDLNLTVWKLVDGQPVEVRRYSMGRKTDEKGVPQWVPQRVAAD